MNWVAADLPARFRRGHPRRELFATDGLLTGYETDQFTNVGAPWSSAGAWPTSASDLGERSRPTTRRASSPIDPRKRSSRRAAHPTTSSPRESRPPWPRLARQIKKRTTPHSGFRSPYTARDPANSSRRAPIA
jgi:hypothetical protein